MRHSDRPDIGTGGLLEQLDRYPFTLGVLAANAILFAFCAWKSGSVLAVDGQMMLDLGANYAPKLRHEPWRLVTSAFLHHGVIHVGLNAWALWSIGRLIEVHFGSARAWVIYLLCAAGGGLASAGWQLLRGEGTSSAGASGGVFGLIFLGWFYARSAPDRLGSVAEQLRYWIIVLLVYTGFLLATRTPIDHAAHAGGALTGALLGSVIHPRPGEDRHPIWAVLAHASAVGALLAFGAVVWTLRQGRFPE